VNSALANAYDRQAFLELVSNLLPKVTRDTRNVTGVSPNFSNIVSLGSSPDLDLQIFEVKVLGSLDKRAAIASDAFKLMKSTASYRTLVAFYSDDTKHWRLSLITAQPTLNDGKVVTKISNPKRFSYLLGPGSKLATPNKQLVSKGKVTDFEDLSKRFALEVVNNEFYNEITKLYDTLVGTDEIAGTLKYPGLGELRHEFAVRLIGRIIFCWFLREKRSAQGSPLIPQEVLSRNAAKQDNYYHSVLAPLFFEILNKHINTREDNFREGAYGSIPYLNGGLFNPDPDDHYRFDMSLKASVPGLVNVPDDWLRNFVDLLESYNFTVDENTSYDIDLSIDPEMLGRIFENLLARINPETGEMVRKATGSFYTPREIVEHMVDVSLNEFLSNITGISDDKLKALVSYDALDDEINPLTATEKQKVTDSLSQVRILDPACGSGAFPIGILQKIVYLLQQVDPDSKLWFDRQLSGASPELKRHLEKEFENKNFNYLRKLGIIRESIYGVDIQPIATEISRLRCFLTLIVDQSVDDQEFNRGIEPLPNLDFKFVTANSLVDLNQGKTAQQAGLFEDTLGIEDLKQLRNRYFSSHNSEREQLKLQFSQRQNKMLQTIVANGSHGFSDLTQKLSTWDPFSHRMTHWFDAEWMFGIADGFDIVIGNPPYGLLNKKQNQKLGHMVTKEEIDFYKNSGKYRPALGGMINVFRLFIVQSLCFLKPGGIFVEIFPLAFTGDVSAANLRKYIFDKFRIRGIDAFPERDDEKKRVFESAKMSVCILYMEATATNGNETFFIRVNDDRYVNPARPTASITPKEIESIDGKNFTIPLLNQDDLNIIKHIYRLSVPLSTYGHCFTGEVDLTFGKKYLTDNSNDAPFIKGAILDRYLIRDKMSQGEIKYLNKAQYLRENNGKKASHHEYSRIAMQAITGVNESIRLKSTIIGPGIFCGNSVNYIVMEQNHLDIMFLLGLLNCKLMNYIFRKFSTNSNVNGYEVDNLPIPVKISNQQAIVELVDKVLISKRSSSQASTVNLEKQIDSLIYKLYELSPEEIELIEAHK
jgi:adenine-specific DNA-methyltransferase